jgi:hypothetical protein
MKPSEIYLKYRGIKQHFTGTYDYFKYRGKISQPKRRPHEQAFTALSRNLQDKEVEPFFVSQMLANPQEWIGNMYNNGVWPTHKKKLLRLHVIFEEDLNTIVAFAHENKIPVEQVFGERVSELPFIIRLQQQGFIQLETLVVLYRIMHLEEIYTQLYKGHLIYDDLVKTINNYDPFLKVDMDRYRNSTMNILSEKENVMTLS